MGTRIEWTDETWNPVTGCTPISEGCQNCYAARMARRLAGRYGYPGGDGFTVTLHLNKLYLPAKWRRKARLIFVCSMGDLFHPDVKNEWLDAVIGTIFNSPANGLDHKYLILTKRPERMRDYLNSWVNRLIPGETIGNIIPNLWLGVTAENQARADERIPVLLSTSAAVHFVSIEPCLGPVDLDKYLSVEYYAGEEKPLNAIPAGLTYRPARIRPALSWVILGGESGPKARPMHPEWARSVRDQCQASGVPFLFKQWGEWRRPDGLSEEAFYLKDPLTNGRTGAKIGEYPSRYVGETSSVFFKVGKKNAGRELDGRKWEEYPEVKPCER